jgi:hypothetical protein
MKIVIGAKELYKLTPDEYYYVYVRLEQAGALNLGRSLLGENVLLLKPSEAISPTPDQTFFEGFVTQETLVSNFFFKRALQSGGRFVLSVAVSSDRLSFSNERSVEFDIARGNLSK